MKRNELLIWAAGVYEGCGAIIIQPEEGPQKKYLSITINFPIGGEGQAKRLEAVIHNGTLSSAGFEVGGIAAVKGFWKEIWPYLSPEGRHQANEALRYYKAKKAEFAL